MYSNAPFLIIDGGIEKLKMQILIVSFCWLEVM